MITGHTGPRALERARGDERDIRLATCEGARGRRLAFFLSQFVVFLVFSLLLAAGPAAARTLAVCIDGTGNSPEEAKRPGNGPTNVQLLCDALVQDNDQLVQYYRGIATSDSQTWNKSAYTFGLGSKSLKLKAYAYLNKNYKPGDRIYIFGFSRGAAIARDLVNTIAGRGLGGEKNVKIRGLGLWDTVGSFGIPLDVLGMKTQQLNPGKQLDLPDNAVINTWHLVAIDEQRVAFQPTLVIQKPGRYVDEVWFPGGHNDIGGGYADRRLADITLRYMIDKTRADGLRYRPEAVRAIRLNPFGRGRIHLTDGVMQEKPREIRVRRPQDSILMTATRAFGFAKPAKKQQVKTAKSPHKSGPHNPSLKVKIHRSAFRRMIWDQSYRPANLKALKPSDYVIVD